MNKLKHSLGIEHLINNIDGGIATIECNEVLTISYANDGFYKLLGFTRDEFSIKMKDQFINVVFSEDSSMLIYKILSLKTFKKNIKIEVRINKNNGSIAWLLIKGNYIKYNGQNKFLCLIVDITKLKNERDRYKIIAEQCNDVLFEYDIVNDVMIFSPKYTKLTKKDPIINNFTNTFISSNFIYEEDIEIFLSIIKEISLGKDFISKDLRINSNINDYIWIKIQATTLFNNNKPIKAIGKTLNIDNEKKENAVLKLEVQLDPLTKLYNKVVTKSLIEDFLKNNENINTCHALMIIDVDNFKLVNDTLGHIFGDSVLSQISINIKKPFNKSDIIGRIGGDEFIVFIKDINSLDLICKKASEICEIFKNTYTGEKKDYKISCSIGVSLFPIHGESYDELLKKADNALYKAKHYGKDCFEIYNDSMVCNYDIKEKENDFFTSYNNDVNSYIKDKYFFKNKIIEYALNTLSESTNLKTAINSVLSKIGLDLNLSGIILFENKDTNSNFNVKYEWYNIGINNFSSEFENLLFNDWNTHFSSFRKNDIFSYTEYSNSDLPLQYKKICNKLEIKSFLQCPILDKGIIKGFIFLYFCYNNHLWENDEIGLIKIITQIITPYVLKINVIEKNKTDQFLEKLIIKNKNLYYYVLDPNNYKLIYISENFKQLFPNAKIGDLYYKDINNKFFPCKNSFLKCLNSNDNSSIEFFNKDLKIWLSITASKIKLLNNKDVVLVCLCDITNFLDRITSKDSLTGLMTLSKFSLVSKELLYKVNSKNYALVYSDFDKFKYINETAGYKIGDKVLIRFSNLLSDLLKKDEIACRFSSDIFLALIKYDTIENLKIRILNFNEQLKEIQKKFFPKINISVISGIYLINSNEFNLNEIIDKANFARKTIKGCHKSQYTIYDVKLHDKATKEKTIENLMVSSLKNKEFLVYLQPKIELSSKKIVGAEALVRWLRPNKTIISPSEFIPLFEKNGFIIDLDFYVYEQVFKTISRWLLEGKSLVSISMNVSRLHIHDNDFIPKLKKLVDKYKVPVNLIELELTENMFFDNIDLIVKRINELKLIGFTFSIDDFGAGYSSLNLLKELPVDVLKLDKAFFPNNNINKKDKIIVSNIVKMAKDLNILVLSEGIETKEQIDFLTNIGCDMVQGYYFSKPMPIEDFEKKLWT